LREARGLLLECAKTPCGGLQKRCASGAGQLNSAIAWVAPVVTDSDGAPLVDVRVKVDGQFLTAHLDGHAFPLDPGVHEFSFSARVGHPAREVSTTEKVMIVEGQRGPVSVELPAPDDTDRQPTVAASAPPDDATDGAATTDPAAKAPEAPSAWRPGKPSIWVYSLGGLGVASLGAAALLTYWGKTDNDALAGCSPDCRPSAVNHIRQLYLGADITFATGLVALGGAAFLFFTSHPSDAATAATKSAAAGPFRVDVQPVASGALATFRGAF
jgi:hypothetical protein